MSKEEISVEDTSARSAMKLALEALRLPSMKTEKMLMQRDEAIEALEEALAKPEHSEPVAKMTVYLGSVTDAHLLQKVSDGTHNFYTTPQQRAWVGLTDDDISICLDAGDGSLGKIISFIEAKLKEKNGIAPQGSDK